MEKVIYDTERRKVLGEIYPGDRIVRASSVEALKDLESAPKGETFTKIYHKVLPKLAQCKLSSTEWVVFLYLGANLGYISNVAKYSNGK